MLSRNYDADSEDSDAEEMSEFYYECVDIIEQALHKYGDEKTMPDISMVDGFLTGIACAPSPLMPSV